MEIELNKRETGVKFSMADAKSEKEEIRIMGGKAQPNSGRGKYKKGDAVLYPFLVDVKESKQSFNFNRKVWGKVCSDASRHQLEPALMVSQGEGNDVVRSWVIGDTMFHQMLQCWLKEYGDR